MTVRVSEHEEWFGHFPTPIWDMLVGPSITTVIPAFAGTTVGWMREKSFFVYMLASKRNGTLYIGVTSDLLSRIYIHREDLIQGFTSRYGVHRLVWYEWIEGALPAIRREKQLKKWNRAWKIRLIEESNPEWEDLYDKLSL